MAGTVKVAGPMGSCIFGAGVFSFVRGADNNAWSCWRSDMKTTFKWTKLGSLAGEALGTLSLGGSMFIFAKAAGGNVITRWYGNGRWYYSDLGKPSASVGVAGPVNVVTAAGGLIYLFVKGTDGHLWLCWWNGAKWIWLDQGMPFGTTVSAGVDVIVVNQFIYAFVIGANGRLYINFWNGLAWGWTDQGTPPGKTIAGPLGANTFNSLPFCYVRGGDGHVWTNAWTGAGWIWVDQGVPPGSTVKGPVGSTAIMGNPILYVQGSDDNLWACNGGVTGFNWMKLGGPMKGPVGATSLSVYQHRDIGDDVGKIVGGLTICLVSAFVSENSDAGSPGMMFGAQMASDGVDGTRKSGTTTEYPHVFVQGPNDQLCVAFYTATTAGWAWLDLGSPG